MLMGIKPAENGEPEDAFPWQGAESSNVASDNALAINTQQLTQLRLKPGSRQSVSNRDMRVLVLIALLLAPLTPIWACSCFPVPEPPCQAAWTATAVFTGTVIDIAEPAPIPPQPAAPQTDGPKAARASMFYSSIPPVSFRKRVVRLQIAEVLTA
jgi:hypothetical protein